MLCISVSTSKNMTISTSHVMLLGGLESILNLTQFKTFFLTQEEILLKKKYAVYQTFFLLLDISSAK